MKTKKEIILNNSTYGAHTTQQQRIENELMFRTFDKCDVREELREVVNRVFKTNTLNVKW